MWPYLRSLGDVDPALASQTSAESAADSVAAAAAVLARHLDHEEEAVMPGIATALAARCPRPSASSSAA